MSIFPITSAANPRFRRAIKLREKRQRDQEQLILVEGERECERAIRAFQSLKELWIYEETEAFLAVKKKLPKDVSIYSLPLRLFEKLAMRGKNAGMVGVFQKPSETLSPHFWEAPRFLLALHGLEKPGNLGALVRTADGLGVDALLLLDSTVDPYAPQAIRASLGTVFAMPILTLSSLDFRQLASQQKVKILAIEQKEGSRLPWEIDMKGSICLLLGEEAHGLSEYWLSHADEFAEIPMLGLANSYNVASAGAMLLYEAFSQRMKGKA